MALTNILKSLREIKRGKMFLAGRIRSYRPWLTLLLLGGGGGVSPPPPSHLLVCPRVATSERAGKGKPPREGPNLFSLVPIDAWAKPSSRAPGWPHGPPRFRGARKLWMGSMRGRC